MLLVDALHCPYLAHRCADGGARGEPCHRFVPEVLCEGERRRARFCIDRFEYPNVEGARPVAGVSFEEAQRACAAEDKRLCTVREWETACEGPALWPLSTGVRRDPRACSIDRARFARSGLDPAGLRLGCASPFAVVDQIGGVDEWVVDEAGGEVRPPFRWVLAGGSLAGGRACRELARPPSAEPRDDAGFRCCADATAPDPGEEPRRPPPFTRPDGEPRPLAGWTAFEVPDASP
jgi:formylglycine-generating enzyme required for sulfatase activity